MKQYRHHFLFLFILLFFFTYQLQADGWSTFKEKEYTKEIQYLELLDSLGAGYNVYMIGEKHNHPKTNAHIEYEFVTYLHQKHGVNTILLEFGEITGWLVNKFIYENDTTVELILNEMPDKNYKKLYDRLRLYNLEQEPENRIRVFGVDAQKMEKFIFYGLDFLQRERKIESAHDSIQMHLEAIHMEAGKVKENDEDEEEEEVSTGSDNHDSYYSFYSTATMDEAYKNMLKFRSEYCSYYGNDSNQFKTILEHIPEYMDYGRYREESHTYYSIQRERIMVQKLKSIHQEDSSRKYFAEFGKCHIATVFSEIYCERKNFTPFVDRIKKDSAFSVLTFAISYDLKEDRDYYSDVYEKQYLATHEDSIALYKYDSISTEHTMPNFIIVAAKETKKEREELIGEEKKGYCRKKTHVNFNYQAGFKPFDNNAFKFNYGPAAVISFDEMPLAQGGAFTIFEDRSGYLSFEGMRYNRASQLIADTMTASFKAYQFSVLGGKEFTRSSIVNFSTFGGITFSRATVEVVNVLSNDYLTNKENHLYLSNNGFLLELGADFNVTLGFVNVGLKGGYQWDVSAKSWKNAPSSYETSFNGWYTFAYAGFSIVD